MPPYFSHRPAASLAALFAIVGLILLAASPVSAAPAAPEPPVETRMVKNIAYYEPVALKKGDAYQRECCFLDISYPANRKGFSTLVWFHGGGMTAGQRYFPAIPDPGLAIVTVDYRLSPKGKFPSYLEDAAAAVAWTLRHVGEYGGDPDRVFVGGISAGGYLAAMVGMDPRWLAAHGISNRRLAGLVPVSGEMTTHFLIKKELALRDGKAVPVEPLLPQIDENAPLYYVSRDLPPICLIVGERRLDWPARAAENMLMADTLRALKHPSVECYELSGHNHGLIADGALPLLAQWVRKATVKKEQPPEEKK